jgi:iron-sulfur cluster assembly protein
LPLLALVLPKAGSFRAVALRAQGGVARGRWPSACDSGANEGVQQKIISFSERALAQLDSMRSSQADGKVILRMGVRAGGCSGMSYVMDLTKQEDVDENDTIVNLDENMRCVIDPKSLMFLYGMQLDYSDELIGGGFSFSNPNAEETCGCGKSFGI